MKSMEAWCRLPGRGVEIIPREAEFDINLNRRGTESASEEGYWIL